jgi:hypothetical protein
MGEVYDVNLAHFRGKNGQNVFNGRNGKESPQPWSLDLLFLTSRPTDPGAVAYGRETS